MHSSWIFGKGRLRIDFTQQPNGAFQFRLSMRPPQSYLDMIWKCILYQLLLLSQCELLICLQARVYELQYLLILKTYCHTYSDLIFTVRPFWMGVSE